MRSTQDSMMYPPQPREDISFKPVSQAEFLKMNQDQQMLYCIAYEQFMAKSGGYRK
jgi:hypothetical protein